MILAVTGFVNYQYRVTKPEILFSVLPRKLNLTTSSNINFTYRKVNTMKKNVCIILILALAFTAFGCDTAGTSSETSSDVSAPSSSSATSSEQEQGEKIDTSKTADEVRQILIDLGGTFTPDYKGIDNLECENLCLYYLRHSRVKEGTLDLESVCKELPGGSFILDKETVDSFALQYLYGYDTNMFKENEYIYRPPTLPVVDSDNCEIISYNSDKNTATVEIKTTFDLPEEFYPEDQRILTATVTVTAAVENGKVKIISAVTAPSTDISSSGSDETSSAVTSSEEAPSAEEFNPDMDKVKELLSIARSVYRVTLSDIPFSQYTGFKSTTEISSSELFNTFLNVTNPDKYYNAEKDRYIFSVKDVKAELSECFDEVNFDEEAVKNEQYRPDSDGNYALLGFSGLDGAKNGAIIDECLFDSESGVLTVKGREAELGNPTVPTDKSFELTLSVKNGKYLIKSFLISNR